jgi:hypothetical protein
MFVEIMEDVLFLIKYFNNHGKALALLHKEMDENSFPRLVLILPAFTRWTSHYLCTARVVRVAPYFRALVQRPVYRDQLLLSAGSKREQKADAQRAHDILAQPGFFEKVEK